MSKKKQVSSMKRFILPGKNDKLSKPAPPSAPPPVIQLTPENAPLWIAKFLEGTRDEMHGVREELAGIRKFLESHTE